MAADAPEPRPPAPDASGGAQEGAGASPAQIERLFREHNAALLRFVAAKLGSEQEAREVAQEAYVKLLSLDRPEAVSYLRGFLFKTAANLALDRLRQRVRRRTEPFSGEAEWSIFDISPERQLQSKQAMQVLRVALDELPGKCRQAFIMHRVHELSCAEIVQ